MASLTKRSDSPFWIACFTAADGRQLKRSTKTADKKQASRIADEFEAAARGGMTAKQAHSVLTGLLSGNGIVLDQTTTGDWIRQWVARRKPEVALSTFKNYESVARRWLAWLGPKAEAPLASLTPADMHAYREALLGQITMGATNQSMLIISIILNAALREEKIPNSPMRFVKRLKKPRGESGADTGRQPFTLEQLQAVLKACDPEWRSMVLLGAYTGQRLSDIAALKWDSIDMAGRSIRLKTRKTHRWMILPMAPALHEHLTIWAAERESRNAGVQKALRDYVHPGAAAIMVRTGISSQLSVKFGFILEKGGIRPAETPLEHETRTGGKHNVYPLSFHSLRHTATSWMKEAGIPQSVVMDFIGHDDAAMSRIYTHTGADAMKAAANALPNITL